MDVRPIFTFFLDLCAPGTAACCTQKRFGLEYQKNELKTSVELRETAELGDNCLLTGCG